MNIASLPFFTPLVKDYLTQFSTSPVSQFFAAAPDDTAALRVTIDTRRNASYSNREPVSTAIRKYHESHGLISDAFSENIEAFSKDGTLAVVTGQQVSLFGGPLYTFYKTLTTIELARQYNQEYPEAKFVPIFWLETEDHDLAEASSIRILNKDGELQTIKYLPEGRTGSPEDAPWRKQVGTTKIEQAAIQKAIEELRAALQPTDFTSDLLARIERCYTSDRTFGEAFAWLLFDYFGSDGLLILDANNPEMKAIGRQLFLKEIETTPQLSEKMLLQSVKLEDAYHAQIKPKALNLFYVDTNGDRLPLIEKERTPASTGRSFFLKGTRKFFSLDELRATLDANPERFSPNVSMRPLYQDTLLPTAAYVAGPGEIAYFAQLKGAYEWAGIPMPLIAPRLTATLVEERFEKVLQKFAITAEDILQDGHGRMDALMKSLIDPMLTTNFESAISSIDTQLEDLRESVVETEATLDGALTSLKGKVLTAIRDFQNKALGAERKKFNSTKQQLDKLQVSLLPNGELQERELSMLYFLNKYGPEFPGKLRSSLDTGIDLTEHKVVHLQSVMRFNSGTTEEKRTSDAAKPLVAVPDEQIA